MFGEDHSIMNEFPNYQPVIEKLNQEDSAFQQMYQEYHAHDKEIRDIEQNVEPVSDTYAEDLKKKRALLKDKIYEMLQAHSN